MASKVLTQPWVSLPTTPSPLSSNNLAFPTLFPSFKSTPISISRASSTKLKPTLTPVISRRPVLVKAESTEGTADENPKVEEEPAGVEEESVAVAVAVAVAEPEEAKPPRIRPVKLGDIMGILNKRAIEASDLERPTPDLRTGDIVQIKLEVPENRRRASIYKGIVISKQNAGIHTTIRIRRIIAGIGVEIVFPVYSPNIKEIKVVNHRKVRRARLYYLRDKLPKLSTFK